MPEREYQVGEYWLGREGNGVYCIYWYDKANRRTRRRSCGTRDLFEAKKLITEHHLANLQPEAQNGLTVRQVALKYWHDHGKHLASADAARVSLDRLNKFRLTLPNKDILAEDWTKQHTFDFTTWMRETPYDGHLISDSTINRTVKVVCAAFRHCMDRPPIFHLIPDVKARNGRKKPTLSLDQVRDLFAYAYGSDERKHLQQYLMVAFTTMARPEAILDLSVDPERDQIEWSYRLINLNPVGRKQTEKNRPTVPINDYLLPFIQAAQDRYADPSIETAGFVVEYNGKKLSSIRSTWNKAKDALGWPMVREWDAKMIRHTMAKHLRANGVPWPEIQGHLGHAIKGQSEVYAEYDPNYLSHAQAEITRFLATVFEGQKWPCARVAPELTQRVVTLKSK